MRGIWNRIRGGKASADGDALTCQEVVEIVTEYLEGGLTPDERQRFEVHLAGCSGCTNYLDQMRETIRVVGRAGVDDLSEEATSELLAAFRSWDRG